VIKWNETLHKIERYAMALLIIATAIGVRWLIDPWLGDRYPEVTLFGGIAVAVWAYGYRPALLAAVVGYLAVDWLFVSPRGAFRITQSSDLVAWTASLLSSAIIIGVGQAMHRARFRAEVLSEQRKSAEQRISADLQAMTKLREIGTLCATAGSGFQECLLRIVDAAIAFTGAARGNLQLFDINGPALTIIAQRGFEEPFLRFFATVNGTHAASCGEAMRTRGRIIVDDITASEIFAGTPSLNVLLDAGVRAVQSTPLVSSAGNLIGMLSTHFATPYRPEVRELRLLDLLARQAADYIERKQAEEALRDYAEQLKQADRRKDEFLATLAHELRNPLAPIRNAIELLKHPKATPEIFQQARAITESQLNQMVHLVDDLLDVSRISRGRIELKKKRVSLKSIVDMAFETSQPHIEAKGHAISISLPKETIFLDADPVRLSQMLSNLINNACKYSEPSGNIEVRAHIEESVTNSEAKLVLSVKDTGIGIAPENLPRLFEIFSQLESALTRAEGGLEIGLSLVKGIVELHDGSVEAKSEGLGKGSEFIVRLPMSISKKTLSRLEIASG
jgi:signal transduction histidine kinase